MPKIMKKTKIMKTNPMIIKTPTIQKSENPESNYINYDLDVLKNLILKLKNKKITQTRQHKIF